MISPPAPVTLDTVDLSQLPAAEREEEARRLAAEEAQRPFDLSRGPLWRASLVKLADDEHVLLLTMHHIVSDGWSVGLLTGELSSGYSAYARGEEPSLPELQIQYADYAAWQREHLSGEALDAQLAYWRERLSGAPPVLELPTDRPRPALQSHRGARLSFALNEEVSRGLHQLARAEGATAFMVLLAAFNALLHRYTNQTDILVGTPVAGRTRSETENLIGCFVNTLVLRTRVEGRETFRELLGKVREACLGAYAHQDAPFERVVEEAQPERSLSHSPLFQVVFVLQNTPSEEAKLTALELSPFRVGGTTAKFDLVLSMTETGGRLAGGFEYSTDLFDEATITRMAGHFEELLRGALHRPGQRVAELPLLPEAERRALLGADAAGVYAGEACLHELFEAQAARTPHAVALVDGEARLTYAELNARANRLARHLRGLGVGPDEPVCVLTERSAELVLALLGVLKAGGAYVPLDPEYPLERVRYTLEDSRARVLVTHGGLAQNLPAGGCQVVNLDDLGEAPDGLSGENLDGAMSPDNLAYVIYTSGSTGEPKGTPVTHRNVVRLFEATREWFGFDERDVWTLFHSYAFDFSVWEMWGALLHGGRLVVVPRWVSRSPELFYELLSEQRVTVLNQTPSAFRQLLRAEQTSDARRELSLRFVIFGGEALDLAGLGPWFDAHGDESPRLVNMYGITETTVHVTHRPLSREDALAPRGSLIGGPIPDLRLYVLDRHMQLVPQGVAGELCVGGAGLARGYLNRAGLTAERFIPDPFSKEPGARLYRSGDLARRLHGGDVEYLGRIDQQVKLRGFRIEPGEIEAALTAHPAVREAVVLPREDEPGERRLVAYVTTAEGRAVTGGELYAFVGRRLPDYMMPAAFVTLDALPLTPNGKVDRRALPPPGQSRPAPDESFAAPRNLVEELLAQMWADVLRVSQAGIHDNFFELGGHSLLATQIVSRVRQTFSVELPLRRLFESPTVAALAEAVERELRAGARAELPPISPVPRDEPLPLSYAQQRLWFIDQLEPGAATYNIPTAVRLTDGPDVTALERALSEVARRHETLRTTFLSDGGRPAQVVNPPAPVALERVDLSHLPAEEREAEARRLTAEEARRPFDLSRGPLWRASLLKLADDEHVLLLTMHHIVSDGWSMGLLVRELSALYSAYARGEEPTLAELPIQYADYAAWQRRHLTDEALGEQLAYWRGQLAGAPPVLELPTDRPRPAVQTYRGARVPFALGEELSGELMRLARAEGVTPFMALLAAFDALLYHYTGQSDILVGSPVAGRTRAETENLIGCFVNTLVLRTRVEGRETFRELLGKVREACLGAYAHQDAPFERVVEEAQPERSLSHSPLFQVVFVLQNTPAGETNPAGLGVSPFRVEGATSKFDLMLTLTETGGRLAGGFEYSTDLFDAATVERMAGHFRELLRGAVERPGQRVAELPLLTEDERRALLGGEAGRAPLPEACLHELFEEQVGLRPEAVALAFAGEQLTYAELNARADRLALRLRRHGVGPESLVGVMLERSADLVVALLGVLKAGGAYLPLDSEYPKERLAFMLEDAAPRVVLTRRSLAAALPESGAALLALDDEGEAAPAPAGGPPHSASPDNLAYVIYTSGSTGRPKGVAVTHRNVVRLVKGADYAELDPAQVFLQFAPVSFDASTFEVWGCLLNGGRLVVMPPDTPSLEELGRVVNESGVTTLWLTAGLFHQMVDERLEDLRGVTQLLAGGDALSARHVNKYLQTLTPGRRLVNGYGPTESTTFACCHRMEAGAEVGESVPIGRQISNTRAYVLDATLRPSPAGVIGELYLGGYGLARGYLNRPALTAGRFVPDPHSGEAGARLYRTGDLVRRRADGLLEFVGRRDGQVKVRGFRVEAGEVEAALLGHASVRECAVAARGEGGARRLVAYVVPEAGAGAADAAGLREHLRGRLPDYMLPSQFVTLESLPLTPNGKVDRGALPAPEPPQAGVAYVAPSTELERTLAGIWADVLGVERVGTDDGFFELGGHSLLLIQAQSKLREALGREVAMVDLFKYPTVRALAAYLEGDGP
ncbi:MAG TPA: amino acid adenylation domain-containing protein, partial [Pyrinomonadaceae bacterium]|nr:amino acid adenylation domain-containing protein [Pyrinomonadaceae bacterium]